MEPQQHHPFYMQAVAAAAAANSTNTGGGYYGAAKSMSSPKLMANSGDTPPAHLGDATAEGDFNPVAAAVCHLANLCYGNNSTQSQISPIGSSQHASNFQTQQSNSYFQTNQTNSAFESGQYGMANSNGFLLPAASATSASTPVMNHNAGSSHNFHTSAQSYSNKTNHSVGYGQYDFSNSAHQYSPQHFSTTNPAPNPGGNFWWSKFQQTTPNHLSTGSGSNPIAYGQSVNHYSTPNSNYSVNASAGSIGQPNGGGFDGLQQYNSLLRNLHSKSSSSTSSSPNSSSSSSSASSSSSSSISSSNAATNLLTNTLASHLTSLVEQHGNNYQQLLAGHANLPLTPDESNSTDLSPSSSILSYSSNSRHNSKKFYFIFRPFTRKICE